MKQLALAVLVAVAACSSSSAPRAGSGDYVLQSIDGHALPWRGSGPVVLSSALSLRKDGSAAYVEVDSFPPAPSSANETYTIAGSWTLLAGDSLRVDGTHNGNGVALVGHIAGAQLVLYQPLAGVWLYARH